MQLQGEVREMTREQLRGRRKTRTWGVLEVTLGKAKTENGPLAFIPWRWPEEGEEQRCMTKKKILPQHTGFSLAVFNIK